MRKKHQSNYEKYQKGRYNQINIKFSKEDIDDLLIYHYIRHFDNPHVMIKQLIYEKMIKESEHE